jgi:predicted AlkP superfamily pyrophosphatase or phosphodiesterase
MHQGIYTYVEGNNQEALGNSLANTPSHYKHSPKKVPRVILIVLDTMRADYLDVYNDTATSPNLKKLAAESYVFENCIAPYNWTLPSHASLFTGYYASEHGCYKPGIPLPDTFDTLAELFQNNGFLTAGVIANFGYLGRNFNMDQGFQFNSCSPSIGKMQRLPFRPILLFFSYVTNIYPKSIISYRTAE